MIDGRDFDFSLIAADGTNIENARVKWSVSAGSIIKGNGTTKATFTSTRKDAGSNVRIEADVTALPNGCTALITDIFPIAQRFPNENLDEFGNISRSNLLARLDNLFFYLTNMAPRNAGLLNIHFNDRATRAYKIKRINLILECVKFRRYDPKRLRLYFDTPEKEERTVVWTTPPGFDFRDIGIDESKLIKAEEISAKLKDLLPLSCR